MAKTETIKLVDLHVNTENYRFEPVIGQKEAIDLMIDDQQEKLFNLAKHIVENGLNPSEKMQVTVSGHDKTKYNVLDGNRRTVALKILNNPDLIDIPGQSSLRNKFKNLHDASTTRIPQEVECVIYDSPTEAEKWIKLKHTGANDGIGTVDWDSQQVHRFEEKVENRSSIALQAIKKLESSPYAPAEIKERLKELKITSLGRLLSDPTVRDFLGVSISKGVLQSEIEEEEVLKGLVQIAKDLLDSKFKVSRIYTKEDRRDYVGKFPNTSKPDTNKIVAAPWKFKGNSKLAKTGQKRGSNPYARKTLIPKSCLLNINNPKISAMYDELKRLNVLKFTNAVAISLRVFVELSMDCYIESEKLKTVNINSKLREKVIKMADHLEKNKLAEKNICKGIRSAVNNNDGLLGIETWNSYIHNPKFSPIAKDLIITWDNIQPFIEKVWENIA